MSLETIITDLVKESKGKYGFMCLGCLLNHHSEAVLKEFCQAHQILLPESEFISKNEYIKMILGELKKRYEEDNQLRKTHDSALNYIGDTITAYPPFALEITLEFDFLSKTELSNVFGDYCADLGITVFEAPRGEEHGLDLYLTKKDPLLKTEAVFVKTGWEMERDYNEALLGKISRAAEISDWTLLVTTSAGVNYVGFDRVVKDMERLNVWLYVVDPHSHWISGITKGKKSKSKEKDDEDEYIGQLPSQPIRAPSQVKKFSKYQFSERDSYKAKNYREYGFELGHLMAPREVEERVEPKFREIFRSLLIINNEDSLTLFSYTSKQNPVDEQIIGGFLSALDTFVSELSRGSTLQEVNYEGLLIYGAYGSKTKMVMFVSEKAERSMVERLNYLVTFFEKRYADFLRAYEQEHNAQAFYDYRDDIIVDIKRILAI